MGIMVPVIFLYLAFYVGHTRRKAQKEPVGSEELSAKRSGRTLRKLGCLSIPDVPRLLQIAQRPRPTI